LLLEYGNEKGSKEGLQLTEAEGVDWDKEKGEWFQIIVHEINCWDKTVAGAIQQRREWREWEL
jgi:hypothetical protein